MEYTQQPVKKNWKDITSASAPSVLGVATGIVLGDMMHRGARRPVAFTLACIGLAAIAPSVVGVVKDKVAGPKTQRGSKKTLDGIRNSGVVDDATATTYLGDTIPDDMYIM